MARIEIDLAQVSGAAGDGAALVGQLGALRGGLDGAAGSAAAAGPGAAGALGEACASWSAALAGLTGAIQQLHANLGAAASAYAETDEQAIRP